MEVWPLWAAAPREEPEVLEALPPEAALPLPEAAELEVLLSRSEAQPVFPGPAQAQAVQPASVPVPVAETLLPASLPEPEEVLRAPWAR